MRVLFVKHHRSSPDGFVGDAFTSLGYDIDSFMVVPPERHDAPNISVTFPDPLDYDAIVPFGAIWSVYDSEQIGNWIGDEIAFTRSAIAAGVPVLGICFGGQLLAAALGGSVSRAPAPEAEIGWCDVDPAPDPANLTGLTGLNGLIGLIGLLGAGPWFQWHYDRFSLPPGARLLARTPRANQAFVQGRSLGLQFHPELNSDVLQAWIDDGGASELEAAGIDGGELMARTAEVESAAGRRAHSLIARFVRDVATATVDATILT